MASNSDDQAPPNQAGCLHVRLPQHPEALALALHYNVCPDTGRPLFPDQGEPLKKPKAEPEDGKK